MWGFLGFYNFTSAISAALGQAWVSLAEDPLLIWNYGSVAILAFLGGIAFYFLFTRPWDSQEEKMNLLQESEYKGSNLGGDYNEEKIADVTAEPPSEQRRTEVSGPI